MKPNRFTLKRIAKAVQTAHELDSLSSEAYDRLVQAGVEDMRQNETWGWKDTVVAANDTGEAPPVDDWTLPSTPCEATAVTPGTEPENRNAVEREVPPSGEEGYGFVWCLTNMRPTKSLQRELRRVSRFAHGPAFVALRKRAEIPLPHKRRASHCCTWESRRVFVPPLTFTLSHVSPYRDLLSRT